jgi:hypothetical protein
MLTVIDKLSSGLIRVVADGKQQLWSLGKLRKSKRCCICDRKFEPGAPMWREVTSTAMNRMDRACEECVERLFAKRVGEIFNGEHA